jgi:hypothetical protein
MSWLLFAELALIAGKYAYSEHHNSGSSILASLPEIPKTEEGAAIPLVYGTCLVRSPILAWAGNWWPQPGEFDDHGNTTKILYQLNMLWIVGAPFYGNGTVSLQSLHANDFKLTLSTLSSLGSHPPDDPSRPGRHDYGADGGNLMFGGAVGQLANGTFGAIEFFDGRPDQKLANGGTNGYSIAEQYMTGLKAPSSSVPGHDLFTVGDEDFQLIPGYRNLAVAFLYNWNIGQAPNMVPYAFEVTALSTGSASDLGRSLVADADPAAVIIDLLTSPWGKVGLPLDKIDLPSFNAASITLFAEQHGYSRAIDQAQDAIQVINDVCKQTDGGIYEEPTTGKIVYVLARNNYDPITLEDINPDNCVDLKYAVQGWSELVNQVRVKFTDRARNYADGLVIAQNNADVFGQGRLRSVDMEFRGCCDAATATHIASRELAVASRPLAKATAIVTRSFYAARPLSVYTLTWPKLGINKMIMRVTRVDLGKLRDGRITLDLVRDVFDVNLGAFPVP